MKPHDVRRGRARGARATLGNAHRTVRRRERARAATALAAAPASAARPGPLAEPRRSGAVAPGSTTVVCSKETLKQLRRLYAKDDWHGALAIAGDWLQILAAAAAILHGWGRFDAIVTIVATLVVASRQRALEHLLHEASHYHLFKTPRLNTIGTLLFVAFPNFDSLSEYRGTHLQHHRSLGGDDDPDLAAYRRLGVDRLPVDRKTFVVHFVLWNSVRVPVVTLRDHVRRMLGVFDEPVGHRVARYAFLCTAVPLALWAIGPAGLAWCWLVPRLVVMPIIRYFGEMSKHGGLIRNDDPLQKTRNRFPSFVERYLASAHNDNYHLLHHLFPGIPFYNLPKAHAILMREPAYACAHQTVGYVPTPSPPYVTITAELTTDSAPPTSQLASD